MNSWRPTVFAWPFDPPIWQSGRLLESAKASEWKPNHPSIQSMNIRFIGSLECDMVVCIESPHRFKEALRRQDKHSISSHRAMAASRMRRWECELRSPSWVYSWTFGFEYHLQRKSSARLACGAVSHWKGHVDPFPLIKSSHHNSDIRRRQVSNPKGRRFISIRG
jgi:hypothetical protein